MKWKEKVVAFDQPCKTPRRHGNKNKPAVINEAINQFYLGTKRKEHILLFCQGHANTKKEVLEIEKWKMADYFFNK